MKLFILPLLVLLPFSFIILRSDDNVRPAVDQQAVARYRAMRVIPCATASYVPEDFLKRTIEIKKGIGSINFPITTLSPEAQLFFNQGMTYFYNFEYVQAARSFYTGLGHDSSAAMLYWGLSQAYERMDDSTESRNMAAKSLALSSALPPREKLYISFVYELAQPANDSAAAENQRNTVSALMDTASKQFPDEAEMWAFTGILRGYGDFKGPEGESNTAKARQAIDNYMNRSLKLEPNHFGVWHYLIHLNEAATDFNKALQYGEWYTKAAPAIPHSWHMYAHDLMKTGRVSEAIEKFSYAFKLEEKKYVDEKMPAHYDWHHYHNMELLAYCYQYKGKFKQAEAIFQELDTLRAFTPSMEGKIRKGHPYFYLQNNQPEKALALAQPLINSKESSNQFMGNFIKGLANVFQKDSAAALKSYSALIHIIDSLKESDIKKGSRPADVEQDYSYMYARAGIINMGVGLLKNPYDTSMFKKMKSIQATLLKQTGPDPWIDALYFLQMLTQMSINTGNLELAENSANNMIKHDAGYPGSYWMLARIKKAQGNKPAAKEYLQKAKMGYKEADPEFIKKL
jgi:tetratricopeptide (TPR) repeat protein